MRCIDYEVLISAYADGELSESKESEVEEHIACCAECRCLYEKTLNIQRKISDVLMDFDDIPDLVSSVTSQINTRPWWRIGSTWAAAAAVFVAIAFMVFTFMHSRPESKTKAVPIVHRDTPKPVPQKTAVAPPVKRMEQDKPVKSAPKLIAVSAKPQAKAPAVPKHMFAKNNNHRSPSINHVPPLSADKAEITVEYADAGPVAQYASAIPEVGPGERLVAETSEARQNGKDDSWLCYRIIDNYQGNSDDGNPDWRESNDRL